MVGKRREVEGRSKEGKKLVIELLLTEVTDPAGKDRLFLAVLNDITGAYIGPTQTTGEVGVEGGWAPGQLGIGRVKAVRP